MDAIAVLDLKVVDLFHFNDGRTVFVGPVDSDTKYIPPGEADVVVNGEVVVVVELEGEMIPNGGHPSRYRAVSTTDAIDVRSLSPSESEVHLRIHLAK